VANAGANKKGSPHGSNGKSSYVVTQSNSSPGGKKMPGPGAGCAGRRGGGEKRTEQKKEEEKEKKARGGGVVLSIGQGGGFEGPARAKKKVPESDGRRGR